MRMKNPPPLWSVGPTGLPRATRALDRGWSQGAGCHRQAMNSLVKNKAGISAEMAIRLGKAFGSSAETWLRMQVAYDLARTEKRAGKIKVRHVKMHWHRP